MTVVAAEAGLTTKIVSVAAATVNFADLTVGSLSSQRGR
jgi:hypothetical protein